LLELTVGADGRVTEVKPLRTTPPFTEMLTATVRDWRFRPAEDADSSNRVADSRSAAPAPVASKVLVAGVFRPPALNMPTLGEAPKTCAAIRRTGVSADPDAPAFPPRFVAASCCSKRASIAEAGAGDIKCSSRWLPSAMPRAAP
jgi:hypothetical protein